MNKNVKLAEEEFIFSAENFIQNIKFLNEDYSNDKLPKEFVFNVDGEEIKVIMLHRTTVTSLMASFKNLVHFRVVVNWDENVILASPSHNKEALFNDETVLEDYAEKIANNVIPNVDNLGNYGSKTEKGVKHFQLWNFYNYKLLLDL